LLEQVIRSEAKVSQHFERWGLCPLGELSKNSMKNETANDPFTDEVIHRIEPKVRDSLTPTQLSAIVQAIRTPSPGAFPVNFRGVLPFFFTRYYFVLLIGRDRTAARLKKETFRRQRYSLMGGVLFASLVALPFLLLLFLFLYLLKQTWGLDFIPDFHLYDVFR
jgi:hypothetical protein